MPRFFGLTRREVRTIISDFVAMVNGNDGIEVILEFVRPSEPVYDPVFDTWTNPSEEFITRTVPARTIQKVLVKGEAPVFEQLLSFGVMGAGDCLFFFPTTIDLEVIASETLTIIDQYGVRWRPIPETVQDFYAYITARFEQGAVSQVIPCNLEKANPNPV